MSSYKTRVNLQACDKACTDCHLKYFSEKFKDTPKFGITCKGIPQTYIPDNVLAQFPLADKNKAIGLLDPVVWAKDMFDWKARWYQNLMLHCSAKHMVVRAGRRVGKSETIAVRVLHDMYNKEGHKNLVVAPFKSHTQVIFDKVKEFINKSPSVSNAVKRVVASPYPAIEMHNGSYARFFTAGTKSSSGAEVVRGQPADCFVAGTLVNTTEFAVRPIESLNLDCPILGGNETGCSVGEIEYLAKKKDCNIITFSTVLTTVHSTPEHPIFDGERDVPAKDAKYAIVSLAHQDLTFSIPVIKARLAGYNFGDGYISGGNERSAGFAGQAEDLEQIVEDLCLLGDSRHKITTTYKVNEELGIAGWVSEFCSTLAYDLLKDSCPHSYKTLQQLSVPQWIKNDKNYIKAAFLSGLFSAESTGIEYQANKKTPRQISLRMVSKERHWIQSWLEEIKQLLTDLDIETSEIKTWPKTDNDKWYGELQVNCAKYNIDAFIQKIGFCYNVKKRISANIWKLYRHYEFLYNTKPWKKNRTVRKLIGCSREVGAFLNIPKSTVKYHRHLYHPLYSEEKLTPLELTDFYKWKNHYVRLPIFNRNKWDLGKADVYNLQTDDLKASHRYMAGGMLTHNCIYLDEADYLAEADINAILAIMTEHPDVRVWASSTPTGFRQHFWAWCENPRWKEFHFPSTVLPHWNKELELECREYAGTESNYLHEYMAAWGNPEQGVYQHTFIEAAKTQYEYIDMQPESGWIYCIGVDWNDAKIGTEICVVGWNPADKKHYIVARANIDKVGWTQTRAIEKLIELNRLWKPGFIYVDAGYGQVQYELLTKFGWDSLKTKGPNHPDSKFREHLVSYNFSSKIIVHDLYTKQPIEKDAKPFLVNNSVRCFEQGEIKYPTSDKELTEQLHDYRIDRISTSGRPVYKPSAKAGDHGLDALNLALVAFKLKMTELGQPTYNPIIGFSGQFGDKRAPRPMEQELPNQMHVNYDPEYERRKKLEQKESTINQYNRTKSIDDISNPQTEHTSNPTIRSLPMKPRLWTNPGFSDDSDWQYQKKRQSRQSVRKRTIPLGRNKPLH